MSTYLNHLEQCVTAATEPDAAATVATATSAVPGKTGLGFASALPSFSSFLIDGLLDYLCACHAAHPDLARFVRRRKL